MLRMSAVDAALVAKATHKLLWTPIGEGRSSRTASLVDLNSLLSPLLSPLCSLALLVDGFPDDVHLLSMLPAMDKKSPENVVFRLQALRSALMMVAFLAVTHHLGYRATTKLDGDVAAMFDHESGLVATQMQEKTLSLAWGE